MSVIQDLEDRLVPQGTLPVVKLFLNKASYFNEDFVASCVNEAKMSMYMRDMSPLQKLAITVLLDSAYIERKDYA